MDIFWIYFAFRDIFKLNMFMTCFLSGSDANVLTTNDF